MLYFAYGSNMLTPRLQARCPGAVPRGLAKVTGHRCAFAKLGMDGSGKATIFPDPTAETTGVLFDIPPAQVAALDAAEGLGRGYDKRETVPVHTTEGRILAAFTYEAPEPQQGLVPFDWYLALILAGCRENQLPGHVFAYYAQHASRRDEESRSPGRSAAIAALEGAEALEWLHAETGLSLTD
ncbi:gamma-glutamylcyclotransferase family protein [Algicella marina]|uniref:Gamma-glutamylcyclotransferase n=1 Tax=Algicella marina TaxID=2683284 RepID=A0A6P1T0C6_9RHOB|nr:gamma-glutamylcyclotransferase family protein [Algicella marina]QHQ34739.1 gamma-glutamylcyclotransferase [Algicella marina]